MSLGTMVDCCSILPGTNNTDHLFPGRLIVQRNGGPRRRLQRRNFPIGGAGSHQPLHRQSDQATSHLQPTLQNPQSLRSFFQDVTTLTVANGTGQSTRKRLHLISINTGSLPDGNPIQPRVPSPATDATQSNNLRTFARFVNTNDPT